MSCPVGHSDAAYVLGALSPADRCAYETHLAQCPECSAAVAKLTPLPGLLGRVDPATLQLAAARPAPPSASSTPAAPPGTDRLTRLRSEVAGQRRRQARVRRWRLVAATAAAAVLAAAGTVAGAGVLDRGPSDPTPDPPPAAAPEGPERVAMNRLVPAAPVTAEVALVPVDGGTRVWMGCAYPPAEYDTANSFRLVAVGADGSTEQLGHWSAAPGDEVQMTVTTSFTDELVRIEVRSDRGTPLLAHEVG